MTAWKPQQVVVGIDGSDQSTRAAAAAAALARVHGARLHVITVVRPPEGWWGLVGSPPPADAMAAAMSEAQKSILDQTLSRLDTAGLDVISSEEIGDPASAIIDYCTRASADLLVVGRRGAGMVERIVLGSVADRLAHHAPCALLIVP